jgi:hypothetical protein
MLFRRKPRRGKASSECEAYINFMGEDFIVKIDFEVTHWPNYTKYGPSDPYSEELEFEIERLVLQRDPWEAEGPEFELDPKWKLYHVIANLRAVEDAILAEVENLEGEEPDYEPDYD